MANWVRVLEQLANCRDLSIHESTWAMGQIISGEATAAQIAAFLMGLRIKGETIDEIVGLRDAVLAAAAPLAVPSAVVDIVGTGGDPYGAVLNISSVAAIVIAACGVPVVKHGNRAASSKSGATDFLDALGLRTDLTPTGRGNKEIGCRVLTGRRSESPADAVTPHQSAAGEHGRRDVSAPVLRCDGAAVIERYTSDLCRAGGTGCQITVVHARTDAVEGRDRVRCGARRCGGHRAGRPEVADGRSGASGVMQQRNPTLPERT